MNNINPIYNVNSYYLPTFKQKEVNNTVITNPINSNVSMNGIDALANYNLNLTNKSNDFDITLVEPIQVPSDINQVEGKRIYNSEGKLMEIVNDDNNYKYVYKPGDIPNEKYRLFVIDKNTNKVIKEQSEFKYTMYEHPLIDVTEFNNGINVRTAYDSKTLVPTHFDKTINTDTKEKSISYDFNYKEFAMYEYDKINNIEKHSHYDNKGHLMEKPTIENNSNKYINLEKPKLHPKIELKHDPRKLNGIKKYYSNGVIEENIADENGKKVVYKFDTSGNIEEIKKDNLTIYYFNDENHSSGYSIKEDFGNGKSKTSVYLDDGTTSCSLDDNGKEEQYDFNKVGDIIRHIDYSYEEV